MCEDIVGKEVMIVVNQIMPLLRNRDPGFTNMVLSELEALWLSGHVKPEDREQAWQTHKTLVRELRDIKLKGRG